MDPDSERDVIIEMRQIGSSVKVTAVDPVTLIEVSIVGSLSMGDELLKRTAVNKLHYVLRKRLQERGARR